MPPGMYRTKWKGGMDSGRHNAHDWMDGPQPVGVTNAICIFDALLLEGALIVSQTLSYASITSNIHR